jgi:hypothetical protein
MTAHYGTSSPYRRVNNSLYFIALPCRSGFALSSLWLDPSRHHRMVATGHAYHLAQSVPYCLSSVRVILRAGSPAALAWLPPAPSGSAFASACDPEVSQPLISPPATGSGDTQLPITPRFKGRSVYDYMLIVFAWDFYTCGALTRSQRAGRGTNATNIEGEHLPRALMHRKDGPELCPQVPEDGSRFRGKGTEVRETPERNSPTYRFWASPANSQLR